MAKIVEFHEAAALAEISLSIEIYKARKQLNNSKEEDAPRVLEHQKRMVQLQKEKEEERKAIVKSERARRQSDVGRRLTPGDVKEVPMSHETFNLWELPSFQEEMNLPSRFNIDTLLSEHPTNVESLLSEMFADDYQPHCESIAPGLSNGYSSASSNPDVFHSSASIHSKQDQLRHNHSSMSWNKPRTNPSPKLSQKPHRSLFGESSDEEDAVPAMVNAGWGTDEPDVKPTAPIWTNKRNAPTPATTSAWPSQDVSTTPVSSAWSNKKTTASINQPRPGSNMNPNSFFIPDEIEPQPTATPIMNSKAAKGKKPSVLASDKSPVLPSSVETTTASSKAPAAETPPPVPATPVPVPATLAPAPALGKKQSKKQRQANKKGGAVAIPATVTEAAIPEKEPETEPVLPQRESPKMETPPVAAPDPVFQVSEHASWMPKTMPAMARARRDSGLTTPSFSWDEITSTPRPAPKIPAHVQEALKSEGTPRPSVLKKQNMMVEVLGATSSRTTLEQMPPAAPIAKGLVWSSSATSATPGPSLWGKTKADFETVKVAQQPVGSDFWVPGGLDNYKDEGDGGGGDEGGSLWESHSKQMGKAASIPVKQQQPSVGAQRLRRVSDATSFPAPRALGSKDLSDIGQPASPTVNSNSKKTRGKKNGKGKQRATIEDVSDEEKDNIDILPPDSNFIMEPKPILEPKPSVPPFVYNPIIDFTGANVNDIGYSSSSFRPTASTASNSSPDDFFGTESRFSNTFKTQSANPSIGTDWGKHARWTPAISHDREESGSPNFSAPVAPRLQAKSNVQQTPIWGQPNPSAKDKGKGKK
jgi:hypothetical protein